MALMGPVRDVIVRSWPGRGERILATAAALTIALAVLTLFNPVTQASRLLLGHWEVLRPLNLHLNPFRTRHALYGTGYPVYDLRIKPSEYRRIRGVVEAARRRGELTEDIKQWAKAQFIHAGTVRDVKVCVRGALPTHWAGPRKSWRIRFKRDQPFQGMRTINLIVTTDTKAIRQPFVNAVYRRLGVMTLRDGYAILRINGTMQGLYYQVEQAGAPLLAHHRRGSGTVLVNARHGLEPASWKQHVARHNRSAWDALDLLLDYEHDPTPENLRRALSVTDVEDYLRYIAGTTLFCSSHSRFANDNLKLFYDDARGRIYRIPWDVYALRIPDFYWFDLEDTTATFDVFWWAGPMSRLRVAMLRTSPYRLRRDRILWNLVRDDSLLDLFDATYADVKPAMWADVMGPGDEDRRIADYRLIIERNIKTIRRVLAATRAELTIRRQSPTCARLRFAINSAAGISLSGVKLTNVAPGLTCRLYRDANANGRWDRRDRLVARGTANRRRTIRLRGLDEVLLPDTGVIDSQPLYTWPGEPDPLATRMVRPLGTVVYPKTRRYDYFLVRDVAGAEGAQPWPVVTIDAANAVTGEPFRPGDLFIRSRTPTPAYDPARRDVGVADFLDRHPQFRARPGPDEPDTVVLPAGRHRFDETVVVPERVALDIEPGARLQMGPGVSIVCFGPIHARGEPDGPILLEPASSEPWGSLAIVGAARASLLRDVRLTGAGGALVDGITFTGGLAVHNADVDIESCRFERCTADDAVNVKHGRVTVVGSYLAHNRGDALDLDFAHGRIQGCHVTDNGGDGIDLAGSDVRIADNRIERSADKGISAGEESRADVSNTLLIDNSVGLAVKDRSEARLQHCTLLGNGTSIAAYRKKPIFGGAQALVTDSILLDTNRVTRTDALSVVRLRGCLVPAGSHAAGCTIAGPDQARALRRHRFVLDAAGSTAPTGLRTPVPDLRRQ